MGSADPVPTERPFPLFSWAAGSVRAMTDDSLPIKLLHDRVLVEVDGGAGERRSTGGIVIPATAQMGKRLSWSRVVGVGANVRSIEVGDRVLYEAEDRAEVELHGAMYVLLRERDVHAVASSRVAEASTGLYL
jgi:chaperonin GroES